MSLNPDYCQHCADLGQELGKLHQENVRLQVMLRTTRLVGGRGVVRKALTPVRSLARGLVQGKDFLIEALCSYDFRQDWMLRR